MDAFSISLSPKSKKIDGNPLYLTQLIESADQDYIAFRLLLWCSGSLMFRRVTNLAAECLEKIMKAYLHSINDKDYSEEKLKDPNKFGHNIKKIREECEKYEKIFKKEDLILFCENYNKIRGNEMTRYGYSVRSGFNFGGDLSKMAEMVDEVYLNTLLKTGNKKFFATVQLSTAILAETIFSNDLRARIRPELKDALTYRNRYANNFQKEIGKALEDCSKNE